MHDRVFETFCIHCACYDNISKQSGETEWSDTWSPLHHYQSISTPCYGTWHLVSSMLRNLTPGLLPILPHQSVHHVTELGFATELKRKIELERCSLNISNGYGMQTGDAQTPGPVPFVVCMWSYCWYQSFSNLFSKCFSDFDFWTFLGASILLSRFLTNIWHQVTFLTFLKSDVTSSFQCFNWLSFLFRQMAGTWLHIFFPSQCNMSTATCSYPLLPIGYDIYLVRCVTLVLSNLANGRLRFGVVLVSF